MTFTLGKEEKLKSKKIIELLFKEGKRIQSFPIQLIYLPVNHKSEPPIQVGFSVPKRNIKLAVNRNRIKRLLREVYRKQKHLFSKEINEKYVFMFIYMAKQEINYADLELTMQKLSTKFLTKIKSDEEII